MNNELTWPGFAIRLFFALLLVLLSYNPSPYSFFAWVTSGDQTPMVYKVISGIVLIIGWAIYIRATKNALGIIGVCLAAALFACLIWLLIEWGAFAANDVNAMTWAIEIVLALILTLGMCWAHIRRKLSGQVTTDEAEG